MNEAAAGRVIQTERLTDDEPEALCDTLDETALRRVAAALAAYKKERDVGRLVRALCELRRELHLSPLAVLFNEEPLRLVRVPPPAAPFEPIDIKEARAGTIGTTDPHGAKFSVLSSERSGIMKAIGFSWAALLAVIVFILAIELIFGSSRGGSNSDPCFPAMLLLFVLAFVLVKLLRRRRVFLANGGIIERRAHVLSSRNSLEAWDFGDCLMMAYCNSDYAIVTLYLSEGRRFKHVLKTEPFNALLAAWQAPCDGNFMRRITDLE